MSHAAAITAGIALGGPCDGEMITAHGTVTTVQHLPLSETCAVSFNADGMASNEAVEVARATYHLLPYRVAREGVYTRWFWVHDSIGLEQAVATLKGKYG